MSNAMFCYQCQETVGNKGCTQVGVCGKKPETAALQDVLIYVSKGLGQITTRLRAEGKTINHKIDQLIVGNLFATITNANFDDDILAERIRMTCKAKKELAATLGDKAGLSDAALWDAADKSAMLAKAGTVGVMATTDDDVRSLRWLITF